MKEQRLGIVTSLAIHAGLLVLFFTIPVTNVNPYSNTIFLSFVQEEASTSISQKETKPIIRSNVVQRQIINKPEVMKIKNTNDESIIIEKPVAVAIEKGDGQASAKTVIASLGRTKNQATVETLFGSAGAPAFIRQEMPDYPLLARRFGKEGKVVLRLLIDKNGKLQNVEVIEPSGFGFTESAIEAIKKSTFSPAYRNGEKIASKAILPVRFNLK